MADFCNVRVHRLLRIPKTGFPLRNLFVRRECSSTTTLFPLFCEREKWFWFFSMIFFPSQTDEISVAMKEQSLHTNYAVTLFMFHLCLRPFVYIPFVAALLYTSPLCFDLRVFCYCVVYISRWAEYISWWSSDVLYGYKYFIW